MNRLTRVGLAAAASGLAVTGAALAPQLGSAASAGVAMHTLKLVAHQTGSHNTSKTTFVGSDADHSPKTHKIVGYDSITGKFNVKTGVVKIDAAVALKGGIITAALTGSGQSNKLDGVITGGTGKYAGIQGTIHTHGDKTTFITFKYHN
jgi:hypothetical protein